MHTAALPTPAALPPARFLGAFCRTAPSPGGDDTAGISESLALVADHVPLRRRMVHVGDTVYAAGERFADLHVLNAGFYKTVSSSGDGREKVVGLHFRGDWLGLDGIATGQYTCDAIAMETGQVWSLRYDDLLVASREHPALTSMLHGEMSRQLSCNRDSILSICTLPVDARVADFLRYWAVSLGRRGMRTDRIVLVMTRAEIGNYLGMTLESVSRALSRLARASLIRFTREDRRAIEILDLQALADFILAGPTPAGATVQ
jgi:CRP/FNR family transcriptional regulator